MLFCFDLVFVFGNGLSRSQDELYIGSFAKDDPEVLVSGCNDRCAALCLASGFLVDQMQSWGEAALHLLFSSDVLLVCVCVPMPH